MRQKADIARLLHTPILPTFSGLAVGGDLKLADKKSPSRRELHPQSLTHYPRNNIYNDQTRLNTTEPVADISGPFSLDITTPLSLSITTSAATVLRIRKAIPATIRTKMDVGGDGR